MKAIKNVAYIVHMSYANNLTQTKMISRHRSVVQVEKKQHINPWCFHPDVPDAAAVPAGTGKSPITLSGTLNGIS